MRRLAFCFAFLLGVIVAGTLSGCAEPQLRQEVSGEVRLNGRPVEDGIINFAPVDGQATGDGAQIVNGKYRIPEDKGLLPGKYKVTIYAGDGRSGAGDASPDPPRGGVKPGKERVPPQYNQDSKVIKEVKKGAKNVFDFNPALH